MDQALQIMTVQAQTPPETLNLWFGDMILGRR